MHPNPTPARRLWEAIEPLHALVYFAPEPAGAAKALGLRGWWMCYFAGRVAPLGPLGPAPVTSMFFGFAPRMVARALPDAWKYAEPVAVLGAWMGGAEAALERALPKHDCEELAGLLERAVGACRFEGRPLAAGWAQVQRPAGILGRLWLAATVLREHRGDGHVVAAVHAGLRGLDTTLTHVATRAVGREWLQRARGWSDDEWDDASQSLVARGLLDEEGRLTESGEAKRRAVEDATDRLAEDPVAELGESGVERVVALAAPLSRHLVDGGAFPVPNPIGAPRP